MKARRLYPTGITRDKRGYRAHLGRSETVDGKQAYVGSFKSEEEAVAAREMALRRVQRGEPPRPASGKKQHSKYRGVTWIEAHKRWRAQLADDKGICRYVGEFRDEKAAARAWDRAARKARGPGAFQNFPAASPPSAEDVTAEDARDGPSALAGAAAEDGNGASGPTDIPQREAKKPSPDTARRVAPAPLRSKRKRGPPKAWWIGSGRDALPQDGDGGCHKRNRRIV